MKPDIRRTGPTQGPVPRTQDTTPESRQQSNSQYPDKTSVSVRPYGEAAFRYWNHGFKGPLPAGNRPGQKHPVPKGHTGESGRFPDEDQIAQWVDSKGSLNIGLRLDESMVGIDVDAYKSGSVATMQAITDVHGKLPRTWVSTSRGLPSGIRFFRLPSYVKLNGTINHPSDPNLGAGEVIQKHHRYAIVWPSVHDKTGDIYYWIDQSTGARYIDGTLPKAEELPELPQGWVDHLSGSCSCNAGSFDWSTVKATSGDPVADCYERWRSKLMSGKGSRHDAALGGTRALVAFRERNWPGASEYLRKLELDFVEVVTSPGEGQRSTAEAVHEWARMVEGAEQKASSTTIPRWERSRGIRYEIEDSGSSPFIQWDSFWSKDRTDPEWLFDGVLARGRGHALYAPAGSKKSLLMLWMAAELAAGREPVAVVYLDYEMSEDDLYERLEDMGYGPESDLSRLCYALLPALPPLDTKEGAAAITGILDGVATNHPDHHILVVIDTTGRAVEGEENSADTFRRLYASTGIELKRRGCTWIRLDHTGKDISKGQRGSKGKDDDPDVVWLLRETDRGIMLTAKKRRMGWVPDRTVFAQDSDPLRFTAVLGDWPKGTEDTAADLDGLAIPLDASTRAAQAALKQADKGRRRELVVAAQKYRNHYGNHPQPILPEPLREPPAGNPTTTRAEPLPEPPGTTQRGIPGTGSPPVGGTGTGTRPWQCHSCGLSGGRHAYSCSEENQ